MDIVEEEEGVEWGRLGGVVGEDVSVRADERVETRLVGRLGWVNDLDSWEE